MSAGAEGNDIRSNATIHDLFRLQFFHDWNVYQPTCTNQLRVLEVTGLSVLTGFIFYGVGNNSTATGLSEKYSLLFFSITLWTFTRMYPAVASANSWYKLIKVQEGQNWRNIAVACASRCIVIVGNESWWPFVHVIVTYSLAGMFQFTSITLTIAVFLSLNTLCYISIGATLGAAFDFIPLGMSMATIISQSTLVAAGFYTKLPSALSWFRYVSPVFWTFRGVTKTALRWHDSYTCVKGQSDLGATQCYLEYFPGINALK
jgi:hypothetical protein